MIQVFFSTRRRVVGNVISSPPSSSAANFVYLLNGDSMALGRVNVSNLPSDLTGTGAIDAEIYQKSTTTSADDGQFEDIVMADNNQPILTSTTQYGIEGRLLKLLADYHPTKNIYLIKYAVGGSLLEGDWLKTDNDLYQIFINNFVLQALPKLTNFEVKAAITYLGTNDTTNETKADNFKDNYKLFLSDMRSDLSLPNLRNVLMKIYAPNETYRLNIINQYPDLASETTNLVLLDPTQLLLGDQLHQSPAGLEEDANTVFNEIKDY